MGRWDFDTAEEYADYMSKKEALPKAAFQYGVKMTEGKNEAFCSTLSLAKTGRPIEILVFTFRERVSPASKMHTYKIEFNISIPQVRLFLN